VRFRELCSDVILKISSAKNLSWHFLGIGRTSSLARTVIKIQQLNSVGTRGNTISCCCLILDHRNHYRHSDMDMKCLPCLAGSPELHPKHEAPLEPHQWGWLHSRPWYRLFVCFRTSPEFSLNLSSTEGFPSAPENVTRIPPRICHDSGHDTRPSPSWSCDYLRLSLQFPSPNPRCYLSYRGSKHL